MKILDVTAGNQFNSIQSGATDILVQVPQSEARFVTDCRLSMVLLQLHLMHKDRSRSQLCGTQLVAHIVSWLRKPDEVHTSCV